MKTLKFFLLFLVSLFAPVAASQTYRVDTFHGDSLDVNQISVIDGKTAVGVTIFKIPNGDTITVTHPIENFSDYAAVNINGTEYAVSADQLCFIDTPDIDDPWDTHQIRWRTPEGRYYSTLTPYIHIICLVVGALILGFLGLRLRPLRFIARLLLPLMIAVACYIEINAWLALHSDMFWWCAQDRFGFWGSALRVLPFSLVLVSQLASYPIYKMLMANPDDEKTATTSIIHMGASFLITIPVIFIVLLVCSLFHIGKPTQSIIGTILLAVIAGFGILTSLILNIKALGLPRGLWFTIFGVIYIIGAMITVLGFGIAVWHLFIQVIITVAPLAFLVMILTSHSDPEPKKLSFKEQQVKDADARKKADADARRRWHFFLYQNGKRDRY